MKRKWLIYSSVVPPTKVETGTLFPYNFPALEWSKENVTLRNLWFLRSIITTVHFPAHKTFVSDKENKGFDFLHVIFFYKTVLCKTAAINTFLILNFSSIYVVLFHYSIQTIEPQLTFQFINFSLKLNVLHHLLWLLLANVLHV